MTRLAILSVHYRYPELLADQLERLARCAAACSGLALSFHPIVHRESRLAVVNAVLGASSSGALAVRGLDLRDRPASLIPRGARSHARSLMEAVAVLREGGLGADDLIALLDHDAHPLDARLFARLAAELARPDGPAAVGIPHWHGPLCYLHPSLLVTRVALVEEMGLATAFDVRPQRSPEDEAWRDTCESFALWCHEHGRPLLPLAVCSTAFPWSAWEEGEPRRTGAHGEMVHLGHLMRYGLATDEPLVSHLCASPLVQYRYLERSAHSWEEVLAAYLAEPFVSA